MKILDRLLDKKAPYILQLLGVYLVVVLFFSMFFFLPLGLGLSDGGMVDFPVFEAPMTLDEFILRWASVANAAGLAAFAIRVAHDLLLKALRCFNE